jgi:CRP-like cAMP-binding protein
VTMVDHKEKERVLREKAQQYLSAGELAKAVEEFKRLAEVAPDDLQVQVHIADLLRKVGREAESLIRYKYVLAEYVEKGLFLQAVTLGKLILTLDTQDEETLQVLKDLSARKDALLSQREVQATSIPLLFADLSEEEFNQILTRITSLHCDQGSLICKEGEEGASLFVISQGEVGIYKYNIKEKKEVLLNTLTAGDFFGEFSFFSRQRRSASAKALTDVSLLEITRDDFDEIQKIYPNITEVFFTLYKKRVVDTILALSPPFNVLSPQDRKRLVERFSSHIVEADTVVIQEGALPRFLYLIKSGRAEVIVEKEGKEIIVGHVSAGDIFGEISLLLNRNHTASVRTVTRMELLKASKEDVEKILGSYKQIRETLQQYTRERLEAVQDKVLRVQQGGKEWV